MRTLMDDLTALKQQRDSLQQRLEGVTAATQDQGATAAILRQKYTVAMEKVRQLQEQLQASEEEVRYSRKQVSSSRSAMGLSCCFSTHTYKHCRALSV